MVLYPRKPNSTTASCAFVAGGVNKHSFTRLEADKDKTVYINSQRPRVTV